jgi:hypothetical protein
LDGRTLQKLARKMEKRKGIIPWDLKMLAQLGVPDPVAALLMQHAFGITDTYVSIYACKVSIACDFIDWE